MKHHISLVSMFAIVGAQDISIAEHGMAKHARSAGTARVVDRGTQALTPSSGNAVTDAFALSEELNFYLGRDYQIALAGLVFALLLYRVILQVVHHTRTLACLTNDTQRFFATPNAKWNSFKRHLIHAPLFKARHNRELRLSSALNMGTLPTRFQSILLTAVLATNVAFCVYGIPWHRSLTEVLAMLRNRTGSMAAVNLIPVMILSSPKNPLIVLLNIPFDSMNIIHRNVARLAIFEVIIHALCYLIGSVKTGGWSAVGKSLTHDSIIMTGTIAAVTMLTILIQASSAIRHAFYEIFVHLHIALVILVLAFLWLHLEGLPQWSYLLAAIIAWASLRLLRLVTFIRGNIGHEATKATIEILPGNAMRVSVFTARKVQARPGSHFYLYIPSVGLWTSHPFSIAWNDIELPLSRNTSESTYEQKMPVKDIEVDANGRQILSAVIRRRTGFTDSLYRRAEKVGGHGGVKLTLKAYVEAGYGVHQSVLSSCGTVMLFAAGVGITHQIPYVKHLVEGHAAGTVAARRVVLVWVMQSSEHLEWIRPWMTQILAMERRREVLLIKLFITQPTDGKEVTSPSATVQMFPGRPDIALMIKKESHSQIGCMGVSVCGPGGFSDNVRAAVRQQKARNIEFVEEAFTY